MTHNVIDPPPRATGDPKTDSLASLQWVWSLFSKGILGHGLLQTENLPEEVQIILVGQYPTLNDLAQIEGAADQLAYFIGPHDFDVTAFTPFARQLVAVVDAAGGRLVLGAISATELAAALAAHVAADEHLMYSRVDGSRDFTGTVGGVDPVAATDLVTLQYMNAAITPVSYVPDSITVVAGTVDAGNVASVQTLNDGDTLDISEVAATPGFSIEADFSGVGDTISRAQIHVHYDGSAGHTVQLQWWNYTTVGWDVLTTIPESGDFVWLEVPLTGLADHQDAGAMRMRVQHVSAGNASHNIFIDYMAFTKLGLGMSTDHGAMTGLLDHDHTIYPLLDANQRINKGVHTTDDVIVDSTTKGFVLLDTVDGNYYRVQTVNGVLQTTSVGGTPP